MLISYEDAAHAKLCPASIIKAAVRDGTLRGDNVYAVWDNGFRDWRPDIPIQRIVHNLNNRRFDSKTIYVARSHHPTAEAHEMASRHKKELRGKDWYVIPITHESLFFHFGAQDGYWDGQVYSIEAHEEYAEHLEDGRSLFQLRIGLDADQYAGRNLYPSRLRTVPAVCSLVGVSEEDVFAAIATREIVALYYMGHAVILLNGEYDEWESRIEQEKQGLATGVTPNGGEFEKNSLHLQ